MFKSQPFGYDFFEPAVVPLEAVLVPDLEAALVFDLAAVPLLVADFEAALVPVLVLVLALFFLSSMTEKVFSY